MFISGESLHCFLVGWCTNKSYVIATTDLWIFIHASNLLPSLPTPQPYKTWRCEQDSHARALNHLQEAAAGRRKQTDQKAADHPLHVGDLVYLRNRVVGRSKIQDRWRPELHVVTARPYPGIHVYGVKPFSGGQKRTLSRDDLFACQDTIGCCRRGTADTGNTCSGQPTVP